MRVGDIFHHAAFYVDEQTGELRGKYILILALPTGGDVVLRLLTSRSPDLRPKGCHHGPPYPGFYLGVLGGEMTRRTSLDLREQDDLDIDLFRGRIAKGVLRHVSQLDGTLLRAALQCAAGADDTTRNQARFIRDTMATLG